MTTQPTLFDLSTPPEPDQTCVTCGASAPGPLFVEPVSRECTTCNHRTVDAILREYLATRGWLANSAAGRAALARHYCGDDRLLRGAR